MIRIRHLSKEYPGGTRALDDVSLEIGDGEFVALIGPSGAGKSSFLRCVNGLVTPTSGEVIVDGQTVTAAPDERLREVRSGIGFVFQQFNLLRRLTVLDNVMVGRLAHASRWRSLIGWFDPADVSQARRVLERIGLDTLANRRVDTLSGGQQQRVAIARALVQSPRIMLADEPMASLDPALSRTVMDLLRRINREDGITVIASLHVLGLAQDYAQRIVALWDGRVVHDGPSESLTADVARIIFGDAPV